MNSIRQAQQIEVGLHDGRIGFTLTYTDGERAHILFHHSIAQSVGELLVRLAQDLTYLERQMASAPREQIGIHDSATVRLTPPADSLGVGSGDGLTVDE